MNCGDFLSFFARAMKIINDDDAATVPRIIHVVPSTPPSDVFSNNGAPANWILLKDLTSNVTT